MVMASIAHSRLSRWTLSLGRMAVLALLLGAASMAQAASTACSDGIDNDGDRYVDGYDPGCHSDGNALNYYSYNAQDSDENDPFGNGCIDIIKQTFDAYGNR